MSIIKIAFRNLFRFKRRTALTSALIVLGVAMVIVFGGVGNSFKNEVIESLTGTSLGDLQIHKTGYVSSIDNLPLDKNIPQPGVKAIERILDGNPQIESYSERIRFGAMISNFLTTTNIRLTAVTPDRELATLPKLLERVEAGGGTTPQTFLPPGAIVIPQNLAAGLGLKVGSDIVVVATNKDGSVNGLTLKVAGITDNISGPFGRDGFMNIQDAQSLLRIDEGEITEIAVRLRNFDTLGATYAGLKSDLARIGGSRSATSTPGSPPNGNKALKPGMTQGASSPLEVHTWAQLSPFASIAQIITLLLVIVRVVLVFIVLASIMNVMIMSLYERVGEIGTIASMGTTPSKILRLFLTEGLALGLLGAVAGALLGAAALVVIGTLKARVTFGQMHVVLTPHLPLTEIAFAVVMVVVVSALASLQPAVKASRMEPVEALRHV
jgi:putative ABC transport system permease protein